MISGGLVTPENAACNLICPQRTGGLQRSSSISLHSLWSPSKDRAAMWAAKKHKHWEMLSKIKNTSLVLAQRQTTAQNCNSQTWINIPIIEVGAVANQWYPFQECFLLQFKSVKRKRAGVTLSDTLTEPWTSLSIRRLYLIITKIFKRPKKVRTQQTIKEDSCIFLNITKLLRSSKIKAKIIATPEVRRTKYIFSHIS